MGTFTEVDVARHLKEEIRVHGPDKTGKNFAESLRKGDISYEDVSIRAICKELCGNEYFESCNPRSRGGVVLREADVDTSQFTNIMGQLIFAALMEGAVNESFVFTQVVQNMPTTQNTEIIPQVAHPGDQNATVAEGAAYSEVNFGEDFINAPATVKAGVIIPITREAIFFDLTGQIVSQARKIGEGMGMYKEKLIIDEVIGATNSYSRKGVAANTYLDLVPKNFTSWDNIAATNGLTDLDNIDTAEQLLAGMEDPNTSEPMIMTGTQIVVPTGLAMRASQIVNATETNAGTAMSGGDATIGIAAVRNFTQRFVGPNPVSDLRVITSRYLNSRMTTAAQALTTWYYGDFNRAFAWRENWPITVTEAPNNSEAEFTKDISMRFKVSQRGSVVTLEPRHVCRNTA